MAFGTSSKIFTATVTDQMNRTSTMDINTDTHNIALYGNTPTPDQTVSSANAAYNAGQWLTTSEVTATGWPAGGLALANVASSYTSNVYTFDADDRAGGASDTVTGAYGCLIFDFSVSAPVSKQAWCFLAFGGSNSVTSGTFTVVFNAAGIMTMTV